MNPYHLEMNPNNPKGKNLKTGEKYNAKLSMANKPLALFRLFEN
jgi:hypothetical protein